MELSPITATAQSPASHQDGVLRLLTCGSVDDGKSTLIGRLLWDGGHLHDESRDALKRQPQGESGEDLDFNLLLDGLQAEREQGITIDIAWRYLDTPRRRIVIIDAPGHEQYTRNMASGASHADLAILLVDARHGIKQQTWRHAAICDLVGIKRVVLAVNKMDLVDWSQARFDAIRNEFAGMSDQFGFEDVQAIPIAARAGHNVVNRSQAMPWYQGPTLIDHLDASPSRRLESGAPLRFPVQMVARHGVDFRGYAGTISSGSIRVGDCVSEPVSGRSAQVAQISTFGGDRPVAHTGDAVTLVLDSDIDISRGAVLCDPDHLPTASKVLSAKLVWLAERAFDPSASYLLRTATDLVPISKAAIEAVIDLSTMTEHSAEKCAVNDIARCRIELGRRTVVDRFDDAQRTGIFKLIDALDGATLAAGVVSQTQTAQHAVEDGAFVLTREMLAQGLCADLGASSAAREEFNRRADEVALLLRAAGADVDMDDRS